VKGWRLPTDLRPAATTAATGFGRSGNGEGNDPLLYLERKAYLAAVQAAVSDLESARVVLAKAWQRIEGAGRRGAE
jgi:hypothetical protein